MPYNTVYKPERYYEIEDDLKKLEELEPGEHLVIDYSNSTPYLLSRHRSKFYDYFNFMNIKHLYRVEIKRDKIFIFKSGSRKDFERSKLGEDRSLDSFIQDAIEKSRANYERAIDYAMSLHKTGEVNGTEFTKIISELVRFFDK